MKKLALATLLFLVTASLSAQYPSLEDFKMEQQRVRDMELEMEHVISWNNLWTGVGILSALVGVSFISLLVLTKRNTQKRIEKEADRIVRTKLPGIVLARVREELPKEIKASKSLVEEIIRNTDFERKAKKTYSILLIGRTESEAEKLKGYLEKLGFNSNNLQTMALAAYPNIEVDDYDLVIFEDMGDERLDLDAVGEYVVNHGNDTIFLYQGSQRIQQFEPRLYRFNFANSRFTLYPRLMESLKFHALMNPEEVQP